MLVSGAIGRLAHTCAPGITVARVAKPITDRDREGRSVTLHGSLMGIVESEILRSVGLGSNPELKIDRAKGVEVRSRNADQA